MSTKLSIKTFIYLAVILIGALLAIYLNSDYVNFYRIGDQEKLGQFGDYVGGILNPIFGFITVLLLLLNLKFEENLSEREQAFRHRDDINELLVLAKKEFKSVVEEEFFENRRGKKICFSNLYTEREEFNEFFSEISKYKLILEKHPNPTLMDVVGIIEAEKINPSYFSMYQEIINKMNDVIVIYNELINPIFPEIINKYTINQMDDFLVALNFRLKLISIDQYHQLIEFACDKAKINKRDFRRKIIPLKLNNPE